MLVELPTLDPVALAPEPEVPATGVMVATLVASPETELDWTAKLIGVVLVAEETLLD